MQKYQDVVLDTYGNGEPTASITVNVSGGSQATIYSDDGVTPQSQPFNPNSRGEFSFYAANGRYDVVVSFGGTDYTVSDIILQDNSDSVTGGTISGTTGTFSSAVVGTTIKSINTAAHDTTVTNTFLRANQSAGATSVVLTSHLGATNDKCGYMSKNTTQMTFGWINDANTSTTEWLNVTGGYNTGTTSITLTGTAINLTGATTISASSVSSITSTSATGSDGTLALVNTAGAGVNLKLTGNGATTPNKYIRVYSGNLEFVNSGYTAAVSRISDTGAIWGCMGTAIPAGGTTGEGLKLSTTSNFGIFFGSGAPSLSAAKGSLYLRSDGSSTSTRMYVNTDGSTTWTAVTTAA